MLHTINLFVSTLIQYVFCLKLKHYLFYIRTYILCTYCICTVALYIPHTFYIYFYFHLYLLQSSLVLTSCHRRYVCVSLHMYLCVFLCLTTYVHLHLHMCACICMLTQVSVCKSSINSKSLWSQIWLSLKMHCIIFTMEYRW